MASIVAMFNLSVKWIRQPDTFIAKKRNEAARTTHNLSRR